ncbi:MAG TPA: hypothetical protein VEC37_16735, partial [Bacillota bacterium]|nr:hypothetical protein [Bacillota bacterium]
MHKGLILVGLLFMFGSGLSLVRAAEAKLIVEAESFVKEEGGLIKIVDGRIESSGNRCISSWNNKDHILEWDIEIPETGLYKVVFRYANGRAWNTYRDLMIDGRIPQSAYAKITFSPTGGFGKEQNNWQNYTVANEKGEPVLIQITKGKHRIRMNNLGGDLGQDGATNFDSIGFLGKNVNPDVLGKPGAMIYPVVQNNNNVAAPGANDTRTSTATALVGKVRFRNQVFSKIELTQNLMYGVAQNEQGQQEKLLLDLYQPANDTAINRPLIIL